MFKPGSVNVIYQRIKPVSILQYHISENKSSSFDKFWEGKIEAKDISTFKYKLKKEEEQHLCLFISKIKPSLEAISYKAYLTGSAYDLAFHRYSDALLKSEINAYRILSSMTSFEAMFSDGSTEITYKIRLRVAGLLRFLGFDSVNIFNKIRDAYSLRSKLVHGVKTQENKKDLLDFAQNYTYEIVNYNRLCLIIQLQLKQHINRDLLIKKLDLSFIDKNEYEALDKIIKDNVIIS